MTPSIQQFQYNEDGSISLKGQPGITVKVVAAQDAALATALAEQMERDLGLPHYREDWERFAESTGMSSRMIRFILLDESESRLVGSPRYQPQTIAYPDSCVLEFGHRGFAVGRVTGITRCVNPSEDELQALGVNVPVEGSCLIGEAQLFKSPLAGKAWEAIERGLFTHVCALLFTQPHEPLGGGTLVEVSLVNGDYPGCRNARIIHRWEDTIEQKEI